MPVKIPSEDLLVIPGEVIVEIEVLYTSFRGLNVNLGEFDEGRPIIYWWPSKLFNEKSIVVMAFWE